MFLEKAVPREARDAYRRDAIGGMLVGAFSGATGPFLGYIARNELKASVVLISLMFAAPAIGSMLALIYANSMEGRKKMPFVVWPGVVGRGLLIFVLFATTPLSFAIVVFLALALQSIVGPGYAAVLKEIYPDNHRGRIMAYIRVGVAGVTFLATCLVGLMLKGGHLPLLAFQVPFVGTKISLLGWDMPSISYRYIFPIAGVCGICSSLAFGTIKTAPVDSSHPKNIRPSMLRFLGDTLGILKEDPAYKWFSLAIFVSGFGNLVVVPLYPVFQVDNLHITSMWVAILANSTTVIWMFSYFYWGKSIDVRCPLQATMINVLLAAVVPLNYFFATKVWMLLPTALFSGVTMSGTELAYFNSVLHFSKDGKETRYQALHAFLFGVRGTIAPFVGSNLVKWMDVRYVFLIAAGMMALGALLQLKSMRMDREERSAI